jgi:hypothetical protein
MRLNERQKKSALFIARPAILAALLLAGQVALRLIPNVEVVTLFLMVAAFVFPPSVALIASVVFCAGEFLIYGFGYWVVAYFIYWPLLVIVSFTLKRIKDDSKRGLTAILIAAFMTTFFGVLTSLIDALFATGFSDMKLFLVYFPIVYVRGIYFYIVHVVANVAIVAFFFNPLSYALIRSKLTDIQKFPREKKIRERPSQEEPLPSHARPNKEYNQTEPPELLQNHE